jgi:hypothetical protein
MPSETVVSTFLIASITGAGLVLAIYALITPISEKIFKERARKLDSLLEEFEKEKIKITADSSSKDFKKDFKNLKNLKNEIEQYKILPRYLSIGIFITFLLFMMEAIFDWVWFVEPTNGLFVEGGFLIVAVISFLVIGVITIAEIAQTMAKEFEEIKKKQKEAKEYPIGNLTISVKSEINSEK